MKKIIKYIVTNFEFIFKGTLLTRLFFHLYGYVSECKQCLDGYWFPHYGVAPHVHNVSLNNLFIGSTVIIPKTKWPENYDDVDDGCGIYYCPNTNCKNTRNARK
jgi:hypothetical protein